MNKLVPSIAICLAGSFGCISSAQAADKVFVGQRAHGMAGANVASTADSSAQFYNPGALGFFRRSVGYVDVGDEGEQELSTADNHRLAQKDFDMTIDGSIGYRVTGDMGDYLTELADTDIDALAAINGTTITQNELDTILDVLGIFTNLADDKNSLVINTSMGANVRVKNVAVGIRAFGNLIARVVDVDTTNLGISIANVGDFNTALEDLENVDNILPGTFASYTPTNLDGAMQSSLAGVGLSANAIDVLDYQIGLGITAGTIDPADLSDVTAMLETITTTLGSGSLDDNTTAVAMTGVGYVEVPVSYGHAINENLSVGVTGKLMLGRVYGVNVLVFDEDNNEVLDRINEQYNESETFSVDVGVLYRMNNFQFGLTGTNLTSPEFEGFTSTNNVTFDDITIDPQVTAGVAWIPHATMTVEVDVDLMSADNGVNGYETQYLSVGAEWNVLHIVALRAGAYQNLAESDVGPVLTGGIGFNLALARIDLAAAIAPEFVEYDGNEVPEEASFSLGLMIKF